MKLQKIINTAILPVIILPVIIGATLFSGCDNYSSEAQGIQESVQILAGILGGPRPSNDSNSINSYNPDK